MLQIRVLVHILLFFKLFLGLSLILLILQSLERRGISIVQIVVGFLIIVFEHLFRDFEVGFEQVFILNFQEKQLEIVVNSKDEFF